MRIELCRVEFMPKQLAPNVLYVAEEFGAAAHLCACGCGAKVRTPLGQLDWELLDLPEGPTLYPSIGNWQLPCRSHYWIRGGEVIWSDSWTDEEAEASRVMQRARVEAHYLGRAKANLVTEEGRLARSWRLLKRFIRGGR